MEQIKVLLDTDIGTDADDAVCLNYLLSEPRCELVGITTVGRESDQRAAMVEVLCRRFDRTDVPIAAGADQPLFANYFWWDHHARQAAILEHWPASGDYPPNRALELMRRVIRENPGEVVLLSVGPMTNLALLAAVDPEAVGMLKATYSMMGVLQSIGDDLRQECNTMLDPTAAGAAFQRHFPKHRVVGLNVTRGNALTMDVIGEAFAGDALDPLRRCCGIWAGGNTTGKVGLHDPLTAAMIFHPEHATYQRGRIGVKLFLEDPAGRFRFERDQCSGAMYLEPDQDGPHEIADSIQAPPLIEAIVRTISPGNVVPAALAGP